MDDLEHKWLLRLKENLDDLVAELFVAVVAGDRRLLAGNPALHADGLGRTAKQIVAHVDSLFKEDRDYVYANYLHALNRWRQREGKAADQSVAIGSRAIRRAAHNSISEAAIRARGPWVDPKERRQRWREEDEPRRRLLICVQDIARAGQKLLDAEEDGNIADIDRWSRVLTGLWNKHRLLRHRVETHVDGS